MTEVIMPKMGDGMEEGTLLEWTKQDGDTVKSGEVIGAIQTDKATLELEAPGSGVLTGFLIKPGDTVPVGQPIAAILKAGEQLPAGYGGGKAASAPAPSTPQAPATPMSSVVESIPAAPAPAPKKNERIKASPLARKIAEEKGLDLAAVTGTGPGGRITEKDVLALADSGRAVQLPQPQEAKPTTPEDTIVPLNRLRQIIAQRTSQAKQQIPHFYVTVEVDVMALDALRDQFTNEDSGKVSVNDFVIKACARALVDMPEANASYTENGILRYGAVNIGIAAAVDEGLLVPVLKNVQAKPLRQIAEEARALVAKAREGKLLPDEMTGSTFSVSNMGMLDVDSFAAIINQPNSAILAIGAARKKVIVNDADELEIRLRMNITGSFDHRVLDGAIGAKFMNVVKKYLENPTRLLA